MRLLKLIVSIVAALQVIACGKGVDAIAQNGICDAYPKLEESPYILPYAIGKKVLLSQGNCSSVSHFARDQFAYDMGVDIGTELFAIRAGEVIKVVERYENNNGCPNANYVSIRHADGTVANYYHLTKDGVTKDVGQQVAQGDTIAFSGNTGCSSGPHLHIAVTTSEGNPATIPISFRNVSPGHRQLQPGESYTATAY